MTMRERDTHFWLLVGLVGLVAAASTIAVLVMRLIHPVIL